MKCQLAAYIKLLKETLHIDVSFAGIILITREPEDMEFFNLWPAKELEVNWEIFTQILNIYYLLDDKELHYLIK